MKFSTDMFSRRIREVFGKRYEPEGVRALADLYWKALLFCGFVLLVCIFVWATWELFGILNELSTPPDTSSSSSREPLSRTQLDALVQDFQARQSQLQSEETNPSPAVPDPSK